MVEAAATVRQHGVLMQNLDGVEGRNTLVSVNAAAVTGGTVFVVIGGGVGIGIRTLLEGEVSANQADASLIIFASITNIFCFC